QDSAQDDLDTDPKNDSPAGNNEDTNADTATSPVTDDSPEATDEDGTEAEQGPEELDEDDRSWRENLASDMKSPMGKLPTWGWMAIILTVAVVAAIAFGILFMGKAKTTAEANESPTGTITPSRPAATTTSKYERDPNAGAPNAGYVDPGYVDPGYYEPAPEPEETSTEPSEETTSKAPSSKRKPSSSTPKPPAQGETATPSRSRTPAPAITVETRESSLTPATSSTNSPVRRTAAPAATAVAGTTAARKPETADGTSRNAGETLATLARFE